MLMYVCTLWLDLELLEESEQVVEWALHLDRWYLLDLKQNIVLFLYGGLEKLANIFGCFQWKIFFLSIFFLVVKIKTDKIQ